MNCPGWVFYVNRLYFDIPHIINADRLRMKSPEDRQICVGILWQMWLKCDMMKSMTMKSGSGMLNFESAETVQKTGKEDEGYAAKATHRNSGI